MISSANSPLTTLLILIFTAVITCIDYHLDKKLIVPALDVTVNSIMFIDDETLAVQKVSGNYTNVAIYNGQNFQNKLKQFLVISNISKPKITPFGIYSNNGKQIIQILSQDKRYQYYVDNMQGNLYVNGIRKYALISKKTNCPTLAVLNFTTMKSSQVQFQQGENCTFDTIGLVKEIGLDEVVYAARCSLYILDSNTLNVKEKLEEDKKYQGIDFTYLDTFYDQASNRSTILVKGVGPSYETFIKDGQKYRQQGRFYNPTSQLFLTDLNKGVSFQGTYLYQWQNMSQNILTIDFQASDQYINSKQTLAVSHSEQFFVVKSILGTDLFFYSISEDYTIHNTFNITFIEPLIIITEDQPVQFTSDDRYLFVEMYREEEEYNRYRICRVDALNRNYVFVGEEDSNCSTFAVLDSTTFDRMISICAVPNINITQDSLRVEYKYYISVHKTSTLQLLSQQQLTSTFPQPVFKLIAYNTWKQYFILQVKQVQEGQQMDQCVTFLYKLVGDQLIELENTTSISFEKVKPAGNFIVSLKYFRNVTVDKQDYLRIYHISNLSLYTQIYVPYGSQQTSNYIYSQKDTILVQSNIQLYRLDIYNFGSDHPNKWYQGSLFKQYFTKAVEFYQANHIIFPNRKLYYLFNTGPLGTGKPTKLIYNITQPPIYNIINMQPQKQSDKSLLPPQDYLYIRSKFTSQCPIVFYILQKKLYKFEHCQLYKPVQWYPLDPDGIYTNFLSAKITFASSQKHIILTYAVFGYESYYLQVRDLQYPGIKVLVLQVNQAIQNADYTTDGYCVYNSWSVIYVSKGQIKQFSDVYSIKAFTLFDTNPKGCIAFSGPIINLSNKYRVVFKTLTESQTHKQKDFSENMSILKINDDCSMFVIYKTATNMVEVWSYVPEYVTLFSQKIRGVVDIKFAGDQHIVVSFGSQVKPIRFQTLSPEHKRKNKQKLKQKQKLAKTTTSTTIQNKKSEVISGLPFEVSTDGKIYARSLGLQTIIVAQVQGILTDQLIYYMPDGQYLSGFAFTLNNTLAISSQLNTLYLFTPLPCLPTYINNNLNCVCRDHSIEIFQLCICKENFFVDQYQNCICPSTFQYTTLDTCECSKGFVEDEVCKQCNFPCQTCKNSATNCQSYQVSFIILIIGLCVLVLLVSAGIIYAIRRSRAQKDQNESNQQLQQHLQN